jgi:peptidoglycan/xylan/chitin deacetylase (PgdA/CDA1 family)
VDESGSPISISPARFEQHMRYLSGNGFRVVSLGELLRLRTRRGRLPWNVVALTFDDGFENNYTRAYPVMKAFGFHATFFLATGFVGDRARWMERDLSDSAAGEGEGAAGGLASALRLPRDRREQIVLSLCALASEPMLSWDQIRQMSRDEFEFGAHTVSHAPLVELTIPQVRQEASGSRSAIEQALDRPVESFCYPYGLYDAKIAGEIARLKFQSACTTRGGLNDIQNPPLYELNRILLNDSIGVQRLRLKVFRYRELTWGGRELAKGFLSTHLESVRASSGPGPRAEASSDRGNGWAEG